MWCFQLILVGTTLLSISSLPTLPESPRRRNVLAKDNLESNITTIQLLTGHHNEYGTDKSKQEWVMTGGNSHSSSKNVEKTDSNPTTLDGTRLDSDTTNPEITMLKQINGSNNEIRFVVSNGKFSTGSAGGYTNLVERITVSSGLKDAKNVSSSIVLSTSNIILGNEVTVTEAAVDSVISTESTTLNTTHNSTHDFDISPNKETMNPVITPIIHETVVSDTSKPDSTIADIETELTDVTTLVSDIQPTESTKDIFEILSEIKAINGESVPITASPALSSNEIITEFTEPNFIFDDAKPFDIATGNFEILPGTDSMNEETTLSDGETVTSASTLIDNTHGSFVPDSSNSASHINKNTIASTDIGTGSDSFNTFNIDIESFDSATHDFGTPFDKGDINEEKIPIDPETLSNGVDASFVDDVVTNNSATINAEESLNTDEINEETTPDVDGIVSHIGTNSMDLATTINDKDLNHIANGLLSSSDSTVGSSVTILIDKVSVINRIISKDSPTKDGDAFPTDSITVGTGLTSTDSVSMNEGTSLTDDTLSSDKISSTDNTEINKGTLTSSTSMLNGITSSENTAASKVQDEMLINSWTAPTDNALLSSGTGSADSLGLTNDIITTGVLSMDKDEMLTKDQIVEGGSSQPFAPLSPSVQVFLPCKEAFFKENAQSIVGAVAKSSDLLSYLPLRINPRLLSQITEPSPGLTSFKLQHETFPIPIHGNPPSALDEYANDYYGDHPLFKAPRAFAVFTLQKKASAQTPKRKPEFMYDVEEDSESDEHSFDYSDEITEYGTEANSILLGMENIVLGNPLITSQSWLGTQMTIGYDIPSLSVVPIDNIDQVPMVNFSMSGSVIVTLRKVNDDYVVHLTDFELEKSPSLRKFDFHPTVRPKSDLSEAIFDAMKSKNIKEILKGMFETTVSSPEVLSGFLRFPELLDFETNNSCPPGLHEAILRNTPEFVDEHLRSQIRKWNLVVRQPPKAYQRFTEQLETFTF